MGIFGDGLGHPTINVDEDDDETDHRQSPGQNHQSLVALNQQMKPFEIFENYTWIVTAFVLPQTRDPFS